jgi:hypothetical protein
VVNCGSDRAGWSEKGELEVENRVGEVREKTWKRGGQTVRD